MKRTTKAFSTVAISSVASLSVISFCQKRKVQNWVNKQTWFDNHIVLYLEICLSLLLLFSVRLLVVEKIVSWRNDRFSVRLSVVVGCWRNDQRKAVGCHVPCGARGVFQQFTKRRVSTSKVREERDISLIWPWSWRITLSKVQRWTLWGGQHLSKRRSKTELRNIADFWDQKVPDLFCGERIIFLRPVLILSKVRLMNIISHPSTPSAHLTLISCPTRWSFSSTLGPLNWSSISNTQRTQK